MADRRNLGNRTKQQEQSQKPRVPWKGLSRSRPQQDSNVTISESRNMYSSTNQFRRPNLDTTLATPSSASGSRGRGRVNLDSTFAAPSVPKRSLNRTAASNRTSTFTNKKADLLYNNYLQALMKQEVAKKTIKEHEEKINDQILIHTEKLYSMQLFLADINKQLENLEEQEIMAQLLETLKLKVNEVDELLENYSAENNVLKLQNLLIKECDLVSVKNIKSIESQEEFDKLMGVLGKLRDLLRKIISENSHLEEIHDVTEDFRQFKKLNRENLGKIGKIDEVNKKTARELSKELSDYFAKKNGYF
ncbi:uncharacterized protein LOC126744946 isoform X1 [Anthonomus grandis grandis]|uniref:uncharacterized protein LOC126744946 isoform X1 n=1 Tax=Anthonomus grandis grandis TaxID=2921223 RepID=UPI002164FC28|nr:uncharacterized protein LOC126744946 isoform X1 [Anthonomus grandis grandis]